MHRFKTKTYFHFSGHRGQKTKIAILLLITTFLLLSSGCKKTPTEPGKNIPPPGSRDYTWIIDTLKIPVGTGINPSRMWGSSAQDVWAVGDAYLNLLCIWHFDGIKWQTIPADQYIDPGGIFGFGKNDIWIGSTDGAFWHYNGTKWSKFCQTQIDSSSPFIVQGISGSSPNDIYAVGFANNNNGIDYKGVIMHYDGTSWKQVKIPNTRVSFNQIFYNNETNEYLINSWRFENEISNVYSFNGNELKIILYDTTGGVCLNMIGNKIYYSTLGPKSGELYRYDNSQFNIFKDFRGTDYAGRAWGRNENDFFTINWGGIGHYNGNDLITIVKKANDDWVPNESIIFEKDFFSIWQDTRTAYTISIHGILKN